MTVLKDSAGADVLQCDGCGRVEDTINPSLGVKEYAVLDPNVNARVRHHYCVHCAANRGATVEEVQVAWPIAANVVAPAEEPAPRKGAAKA